MSALPPFLLKLRIRLCWTPLCSRSCAPTEKWVCLIWRRSSLNTPPYSTTPRSRRGSRDGGKTAKTKRCTWQLVHGTKLFMSNISADVWTIWSKRNFGTNTTSNNEGALVFKLSVKRAVLLKLLQFKPEINSLLSSLPGPQTKRGNSDESGKWSGRGGRGGGWGGRVVRPWHRGGDPGQHSAERSRLDWACSVRKSSFVVSELVGTLTSFFKKDNLHVLHSLLTAEGFI